mgnify:CR=1 FL=1
MDTPIVSFRDKHAFLSNFTPCYIDIDGHLTLTSVEHEYQAAKALVPRQAQAIRECATAGLAKRAGRKCTMRPDWNEIKLDVMLGLLRKKFAIEPFRSMLLATGNAALIEGNDWGDKYWGVVRCGAGWEGHNHLGRLLVQVRRELAETNQEA